MKPPASSGVMRSRPSVSCLVAAISAKTCDRAATSAASSRSCAMSRHLLLLFALYCGIDRLVAQPPPTLVREERAPVMVSGSASSLTTWLDGSTLALADVEEQRVMMVDAGTGKVRAMGRPG